MSSAARPASPPNATVPFQAALSVPHEIKTVIKRKNAAVATTAVAFHSSVLHSQLVDGVVQLRLNKLDPDAPPYDVPSTTQALWNALFKYFARGRDSPDKLEVEPVLPAEALDLALMELGATKKSPRYTISRSAIFQLYTYASDVPETHHAPRAPFPYLPITPPEGSPSTLTHPLRPPKPNPSSLLYSRFLPHLTTDPQSPVYFKLSTCTLKDLPTLHNWMNDPRVDQFWMEKGSMEQHQQFIEKNTRDPHVIPVIGSYVELREENGQVRQQPEEQAVYAEVYWVKEDRLAPLMPAGTVQDYDRGLHMLVGSNAHRGPHRIRAWMPSLAHYCFLDDPRTQRVICEPNEKNEKIIKYMESIGFKRHGSVTFPHKTSALMILEKEDFYSLCPF
ncbi:putative lysine N-acyltransferase C17G9.06c [Rhodotorula toruloides]|nr:putative lysine N-acyltransferase C17G9.06c [Rhodotorula toruloides]